METYLFEWDNTIYMVLAKSPSEACVKLKYLAQTSVTENQLRLLKDAAIIKGYYDNMTERDLLTIQFVN